MLYFLQEAEQYKFSADEVQIALNQCKDSNPIEWLKQNWRTTITSVVTLATQMGREMPMNIIGTISEKEAREALILHKGVLWPAVTECVEQRQKKVSSLQPVNNIPTKKFASARSSRYTIFSQYL